MGESPHGIFVAEGDRYLPMPLARGPWGDFLSGQYVGGLLAAEIERQVEDVEMHPARITVDLSGRAALKPVRVRTTVRRQGSRIHLVDAEMVQGDNVVAHARAVFLRHSEQPPNQVWTAPVAMPAAPEVPSAPPAGSASHGVIYAADQPDTVGTDLKIWETAGQKFIWLTYLVPLVSGEKPTPLTRAVMVADSASAVANYGTAGLHVINADYTVSLSRLPEGISIGMAGLTHHSQAGIATGSVVMYDELGPIGTAVTTGIANRGFRPHVRSR